MLAHWGRLGISGDAVKNPDPHPAQEMFDRMEWNPPRIHPVVGVFSVKPCSFKKGWADKFKVLKDHPLSGNLDMIRGVRS